MEFLQAALAGAAPASGEACPPSCECDSCSRSNLALNALMVLQQRQTQPAATKKGGKTKAAGTTQSGASGGGAPDMFAGMAGMEGLGGLIQAFSDHRDSHDVVVQRAPTLSAGETAVGGSEGRSPGGATGHQVDGGTAEIDDPWARGLARLPEDPNAFFPKDYQHFLLTGTFDRLSASPSLPLSRERDDRDLDDQHKATLARCVELHDQLDAAETKAAILGRDDRDLDGELKATLARCVELQDQLDAAEAEEVAVASAAAAAAASARSSSSASALSALPASPPSAFIAGCGRSGTTLLGAILASDPSVVFLN